MVAQGHRAVMLYLVQRTDCDRMTLAGDIDPTYAQAWRAATAAGVETLALDCHITPEGVQLGKSIQILAPSEL
jgi:sugar fermentation stimulation protein A